MLFSPPTRHALRALTYIARRRGSRPVLSREIATAESIPPAFLSKILRRLCAEGLLRSTMGPGGGYALARPARDIQVGDVIAMFDDLNKLRARCILRPEPCDEQEGCVLHRRWKRLLEGFTAGIASVTLEEIASGTRPRAASQRCRRGPIGERGRHVA